MKVEDKLTKAFQAMPDGVSITRLSDGMFLYVNPGLAKYAKYPVEKIVGRTVSDLNLWGNPEERAKLVKKLEIEGEVRNFEIELQTIDGESLPMSMSASLIEIDGEKCMVSLTRDTTESKRMEEALRSSEERFRDLVNLLPQTIYEADMEGNIIFVNSTGLNAFGGFAEDIDGKTNIQEAVIPNDRERIFDNLQKILQGEMTAPNEYTMLRKDGGTFPAIVYSSPIVRVGKTIGIRGLIIDISERKQAEEALNESENKYRTLFEQSADALLILEVDTFVDCNMATVKMFGFENKEQFTGVHPSETSPEKQFDGRSSFDKSNEMMSIAYEQGSYRFEWDHMRKNGEIFPAEVLLTAVPLGDKKFIHGVIRDITERKQAEEALMEGEERFKAAFADAAIGMTLVSLDHTIIEANQAYCNMLGYTKDELKGVFLKDVTHPDDVENSLDYHHKLIAGELDNYHIEKRYIHKQGHELWGDLSVSLVRDKDGEPLYSVAQIQDITERKRAEKALQTIAEGVSGAVGDTFFNFVVKYLAETLEVEYAFVGTLIPEKNRIRTIAVYGHGKTMENFEYDLKGTPCENVFGQQFCIYEEDLQKDFPDDQLLVDMGVNSYAAGPLFDSDSRPTGIMVVLSSQPFKHVALAESLLRILGIRCAAEFERKQAEDDLLQYQMQLRALASEITIAEEQERRRIAIELHDYIIQDLGLSKIKLGELVQRLSTDDCLPLAEETRELIEGIIKETRSLVFDLSLPVLYDLGYVAAIKWLAEQTAEKLNISCDVQDDGQPKPMNKEMQVLLFKAVRELMNNISKHAHANKVNILINRVNGQINTSVQDDGVGFDPAHIELYRGEALKFGLFGIKERLNLLNGFVKISSTPGSGTNITLTAPLEIDD